MKSFPRSPQIQLLASAAMTKQCPTSAIIARSKNTGLSTQAHGLSGGRTSGLSKSDTRS
jgi:hypothetical protein